MRLHVLQEIEIKSSRTIRVCGVTVSHGVHHIVPHPGVHTKQVNKRYDLPRSQKSAAPATHDQRSSTDISSDVLRGRCDINTTTQ